MLQKYSIEQLLKNIQENWPETHTLECEIALGAVRLNDLIIESTKEALNDLGMSQSAFEVLTTLRSYPQGAQLTPTELYKAVLITSGGMTKVLKHLEEQNWIERLENPDDKRSRFVRLTVQGRDVIEQAMQRVDKADQKVLSEKLAPQDLQNLRDVLLSTLAKLEAN